MSTQLSSPTLTVTPSTAASAPTRKHLPPHQGEYLMLADACMVTHALSHSTAHARLHSIKPWCRVQRTACSTLHVMLHSGSSKDHNHYCPGSPHRLGSLRDTYGQPEDSQYVFLATLSCCWQQLVMFSLGARCLHRSDDTKSVRRVQMHLTGGLANNSGTSLLV